MSPCRECHRFVVIKDARSCPYCGVSRPRVPEGRGSNRYHGAVALSLSGLIAAMVLFHIQAKQLSSPLAPPPSPGSVDSFPGYRSLATGLWRGAQLYNRAGIRMYVGRITSLDCPDPTPRGRVARCFQIEFADGHRGWVRWHAAKEQYLAAVLP